MRKIFIISLLFFTTSATATKTYLFKNFESSDEFITQNDNYNYEEYILEENQVLVVPPENGILANDSIKHTNYVIKIFENTKNSKLEDLELNEITGSFSYSPNNKVKGNVSFKYYIEYDGKKTNVSYITFFIKDSKKNNNEKIPYTGV